MNAYNERLLVITAIEDADTTTFRQSLHATPKIIVVEFFRGRSLEGVDFTTLWIHSRHNMLDGAVFSGRIHSLEDQEHGPAILRVEFVLWPREELHATCKLLLCARFVS